MKTLLAILFVAAGHASGGVDGTVVNRGNGKPQPGVIVSLIAPGGGGMKTLGTVKTGAAGKFHFDNDPQGPRVLQAIYEGVIYTQAAPPGTPASDQTIGVFESTRQRAVAKLTQHMVLLQPTGQELSVSEDFLFRNESQTTFHDPAAGSARVFIPESARVNARVRINAPGGMPIERTLMKTKQAGVYAVEYPLKPGETRFEVNYTLPAADPMVFASRVEEKGAPLRLVTANGVTLKGDDLEPLGQEPTTGANLYNVAGGGAYRVTIEGIGTLGGGAGAAPGEDSGAPSIQRVNPRVYDRLPLITGLALAILALGSILLYRRGGGDPRRS